MTDRPTGNDPRRFRDALIESRPCVERFEKELFLAHLAGRDRGWLWAHLDDPLPDDLHERFQRLLDRRERGEPVAYILGVREFYGRAFAVSPAVLIPRPETETLIERALDLLTAKVLRAVDVGTGSGAIALTLAAERPSWQIIATDLSPSALKVAAANRDRMGLERVDLLQADLLEGVPGSFDLIISNPPYVAASDPHLSRGDLRFEPAMALSCGEDGLELLRKLVDQSASRLNRGGWLLLEHGYDQADSVRALLRSRGFDSPESWADLAGIERVSGARWPG
jgi:release factor glutamine methyltransferase